MPRSARDNQRSQLPALVVRNHDTVRIRVGDVRAFFRGGDASRLMETSEPRSRLARFRVDPFQSVVVGVSNQKPSIRVTCDTLLVLHLDLVSHPVHITEVE